MSHPTLERHLERQALRPLYLFYGEEEFLMERAWRRLEQAMEEKAGTAPLRVIREAQEISLEEFLAQARVPSLWGSGQLLVLRRVEAVPDKSLKGIPAYLEHPPAWAYVILTAPGLKAREVGKHPVWSRLQRDEAALAFWRLKEEELYSWLTREARAMGKTLTLPAAQRLVEVVGANLAELNQELEKLALFAGPEKTLSPHLVSQVASHSRTFNIFALVEALGESDPQKRLAALDHLMDLGEPPARILAMLARQLRMLIHLKETAPNAPPPQVAGKLNLPPGLVNRLSRQAQAFSRAALRSHLVLLHQADRHLKTSTANPRLWLEWALLHMGPG